MPWNGQRNYGPWNALADILSAYIQKKAIDGANEYATSAFNNDAVAQAQEGVEAAQKQADQHSRIVEQGPKKYTGNVLDYFKTGMKSGPEALMGNTKAASPSMMQAMDAYSKDKTGGLFSPEKTLQPNLIQQQGQPQVQQQSPLQKGLAPYNQELAKVGEALGQENVSEADRAKLMAQQQALNQEKAQAEQQIRHEAAANTPALRVDAGFGKEIQAKGLNEREDDQRNLASAQIKAAMPMPYEDYVADLKQKKAIAMKEMVRKYGVDAAKQAQSLIDDTYNSKISAYSDRAANVAMNNLSKSMYGQDANGNLVRKDLSNRENRIGFLYSLQNYNNLMDRVGRKGFDMNIAKEIMATDAVKTVSVDDGGTIHFLGQRTDGSMFEVGKLGKTLSPVQKAQVSLGERKFEYQQKHDAEKMAWDKYKYTHPQTRSTGSRSGSSGSGNAKYRELMDGADYKIKAAMAALESGETFTDPDNHSFEEARQYLWKALESGLLDDEDKAAVEGTLKDMESAYYRYREHYSN